MKIVLNREQLLRKLRVCERIVPRRGGLPFFHSIYVMTDTEGEVTVWATNGREGYSSTMQALEDWEDGTTAIAAQELVRAVAAAPGETVTIETSSGMAGADITSGTARWHVEALAGVLEPGAWEEAAKKEPSGDRINRAELIRVLEATRYAMARTESRPSLRQIHVGEGRAVASDGRRVHQEELGPVSGAITFDIPERAVETILEALAAEGGSGQVTVENDGDSVSFWFGGMLYEVGAWDYPFPDIDGLSLDRARSQTATVTASRDDLVTAIKVAAVSIDEGDPVKLRFTNGVIEVVGSSQRGVGRMEVRCSNPDVGSGAEINIRADDLLEVLGKIPESEDGDIVFTIGPTQGDPGWFYIHAGGTEAAVRPVAT